MLAEDPKPQLLQEMMMKENFLLFYENYCRYKAKARSGEMGKTFQFRIQYMDKVWLVLQCLRATKENDLNLHIKTIQDMCPMFFSFNHQNYARYLTTYLLMLLNLPDSHPGADELLRNNGFSVSRSAIPCTRNPVDITIEQTINRHAKCKGGIIGFSKNYSAYYRWCMTRHQRASYVSATLDMANVSTSETASHKDTRYSQKK